jgi:hypothetical protein
MISTTKIAASHCMGNVMRANGMILSHEFVGKTGVNPGRIIFLPWIGSRTVGPVEAEEFEVGVAAELIELGEIPPGLDDVLLDTGRENPDST